MGEAEVEDPGRPYLIRYDYTESGVTQRCAFICRADNGRAAAENFANQHPGEWFRVVSVSSGGDEPFWLGGTAGAAEPGRLYLLTYHYTESGMTQKCGMVCHARNVRGAAEAFWNQHPGEWSRLVSVNDGSIEAFWSAEHGRFFTVPEREREAEL